MCPYRYDDSTFRAKHQPLSPQCRGDSTFPWRATCLPTGRLVINPSASSGPGARVERRQLRARRSYTSSRWLWIAKAKVRMYASSWTTGLRWLTSAASRHRPAPKGEGLRAIHIPRCMVFTRKETRRKAPFLRQAQDRPKVTQNGHSERSNLTVDL